MVIEASTSGTASRLTRLRPRMVLMRETFAIWPA